jgi:superkiller protein 3
MRGAVLTLCLLLTAGVQAAGMQEKILADTQYNLAFSYYRSGKLEEAKAPLAKALATVPEHPQANLLSGIIACTQGRFDDGVKFLKTAQLRMPANADIYQNLGVAYSNLGKLKEAEEAFAAEAKVRPSTPGLNLNLGVLALKQKNYKGAVLALQKAAQEEPTKVKVWLVLADALDGAGDKAAATEAKAKALELDPAAKGNRVELGQRLYEAGQLTRAAAVLAPLQDQGDAGAEFLLGVLAYRDGRFDDSRTRFEAALKARPDYTEARYNLAITHYDQGHFEEAVSQFQEVLRLHPGDEDAKKNLDLTRQAAVRSYLNAGSKDFLAPDYLAALGKWRKAQALDKDNKVVRDLVETAQAQLKLQGEELNATAKADWAAGKKEEAIQAWASALERDPDSAEAQQGLDSSKAEAAKLKGVFQKAAEAALADGRLAKAREAAAKVGALDKAAGKALSAKVEQETKKRVTTAKDAAQSAHAKGDLAGEVEALQTAVDLDAADAGLTLRLNQAKVNLRQSLDASLAAADRAEKAGKADEAFKQFRKAATLQPGNGTARDGMKRLGAKAKTKGPNPAELDDWYYQGVYAYAAGETDKAQELWKKVLAADSQHRLAKEALDRAQKRAKALSKG